jgi:hypothetical protein
VVAQRHQGAFEITFFQQHLGSSQAPAESAITAQRLESLNGLFGVVKWIAEPQLKESVGIAQIAAEHSFRSCNVRKGALDLGVSDLDFDGECPRA